MSEAWPLLVLAALLSRWWWVLAVALFQDLRAAEVSAEPAPGPDSPSLTPPGAGRAPLHRGLACRGVARRAAARRRWEGGFGRRGP